MLSGCILLPESKETEQGSGNQEASPSAGKNTRIVFVQCQAWQRVPTALPVVWFIQVSLSHLFLQMSSQ